MTGLWLGDVDVPQTFFLFSFLLSLGEEGMVAPEEGDKGWWGRWIGRTRRVQPRQRLCSSWGPGVPGKNQVAVLRPLTVLGP